MIFTELVTVYRRGRERFDVPCRVKILFLDDDPDVRRSVARVLRSSGAGVVVASCCAEARAVTDCALGVFDVELPDGDGVELAAELLQTRQLRAVVFFTGGPTDRASGVGAVVIKGSGNQELRSAVHAALARLSDAGE